MEDELDDLKYLWDGTEPDCYLVRTHQTLWLLFFEFDATGPSKFEIITLHKLLPEFKSEKLPLVYEKLKGVTSYSPPGWFGYMGAVDIEAQARRANMRVRKEGEDIVGYAIMNGNRMLLIEDEGFADRVVQKMLAAGVKVVPVEVD